MSLFFKPTPYNGCTKNQMWMSMIGDCHDIHCGCNFPFAHLLDSIFPEGHQDRDLTVDSIIKRDLAVCHSGGGEEEDHGLALGTSAANLATKEEKLEAEDTKEDIEELLAAAAAVEER